MSKYNDTIYALSTPVGKSAIAVIRISGKKVFKTLEKITKLKKIIPNKTNILFIKHKGLLIDQVTLHYYKGPKSFTGEDTAEINCHGGIAVISKISKTLEDLGLRLADPGEFTKRALLNDKIDLVKTESISDIINAETEKQRELAIKNLNGDLTKFTKKINEKISINLANIEALIDFSDEDLPVNILNKIKEQNKNIIKEIKYELKKAEFSKPIRDGIKIAIIGKPNTGKSSFINFISKKDISIVTDIPGTTTDLISSSIDIKGFKFTFYDTAGLRKHKNKIEEIGITKTKNISENSDLNLIFLEKNEKSKYKQVNNKIFVRSKYDIRRKNRKLPKYQNISSVTGSGVDSLMTNIFNKIIKKNKNESILSRERHISIMKKTLNTLNSIDFNTNIDIIAYEYRLALDLSLEINQKFDIEKILDIIFRDFCIGK
ncbi:tRNA uridine-5-carboxymethylaminomethyl(34) synthesis GTPase MnmE [Pelagibacterales bacterium SAG-MED31]|nr:tRNA uridine-5-carboxymethylaminomethyl(34) synthesis GTPase MnmE [Pelagibacterales bacterium SAG-MED31]